MTDIMNMQLAMPTGSLEAYIHSVNQIPVLSAEEERQLAIRLRDDNDIEAARSLVLSHLRFVVRVARGYSGYGLSQADLIQEGNIGLMKAVKRFDPEMGVRLISFAVHWIRAEIHEFILKNWRVVKVATTKAQRKLFFNLRSAKKRLGWLNQDEVNEIAQDLGVSSRDVLEMEKRLSSNDTSFDGPAQADNDENDLLMPAGYLEDQSPNPEQEIESLQNETIEQQRLSDALASLDERNKTIIRKRWLSENKSTLHELAEELGVSAERVRQLEQNAIKKLKSSMSSV